MEQHFDIGMYTFGRSTYIRTSNQHLKLVSGYILAQKEQSSWSFVAEHNKSF